MLADATQYLKAFVVGCRVYLKIHRRLSVCHCHLDVRTYHWICAATVLPKGSGRKGFRADGLG